MHFVALVGCVLIAVNASIVTETLPAKACEQVVLGLSAFTRLKVVVAVKFIVVIVATFAEPIVTVAWVVPLL